MIFIDWEKAFDKIHPDAIPKALLRHGVPPQAVHLIVSLLASPSFRVDMDSEFSEWEDQGSGIRQ
eukprot:15471162-Alexandrium_andersonii.AAC.1